MLAVEGITVEFGGLVAVNEVSFHVKPGEIHSIIGPNGAGKTTIFNAITGFCPLSRGRLIFKGEDVTGFRPHEIAGRRLARTFQRTNVFQELTVLENVITASNLSYKSGFWRILVNSPLVRKEENKHREKAGEILELCGIAGRSDEISKNLSYGEGRHLEIAIALAVEPKLILLDEPAAGLNPVETRRLTALIKKIRDTGYTILLVEHDMSLVMEISDFIDVINFGKTIARGLPEEVANNEEVIEAYLGKSIFQKQETSEALNPSGSPE